MEKQTYHFFSEHGVYRGPVSRPLTDLSPQALSAELIWCKVVHA